MKYLLLIFSLLSLLLIGCEDESDAALSPTASLDGLSLLGLVDGRTLVYLQTNSNVSFNPFQVSFSDTTLSVLITGVDNDWIIHKGTEPVINLKVSDLSIIQNGYWRNINGSDSLIYIASPPLLFERNVVSNPLWEYYTPFYQLGTGPSLYAFYYANFGFSVSKEYLGTEDIITPAGEFSAHKYQLELITSQFGTSPVAHLTEYYAPNVGLIKQELSNGGNSQTIILVSFTN